MEQLQCKGSWELGTACGKCARCAATKPSWPSTDDAELIGASGGDANEGERRAFEAWMRGHCWALCATWDGKQYRSDAEQGGNVCPNAMRTRQLWAAWRDRAALARAMTPNAEIRGGEAVPLD